MEVSFYMDHHVPRAVTEGLRLREIRVTTAREDGRSRAADINIFDRATELGCVVFSQDTDFLREAAKRQRQGVSFPGLVYAPQIGVTIGGCVKDLALIAKTEDPADLRNQVIYLPL